MEELLLVVLLMLTWPELLVFQTKTKSISISNLSWTSVNRSELLLADICGLCEWVNVTLVCTWDYWATSSRIWSTSVKVWSTKGRVVLMIKCLTLLLDLWLQVYRVAMAVMLSTSYSSCMSGTLMLRAMPWVLYRVLMCLALVNTLAVAMRMRVIRCDPCI